MTRKEPRPTRTAERYNEGREGATTSGLASERASTRFALTPAQVKPNPSEALFAKDKDITLGPDRKDKGRTFAVGHEGNKKNWYLKRAQSGPNRLTWTN